MDIGQIKAGVHAIHKHTFSVNNMIFCFSISIHSSHKYCLAVKDVNATFVFQFFQHFIYQADDIFLVDLKKKIPEMPPLYLPDFTNCNVWWLLPLGPLRRLLGGDA